MIIKKTFHFYAGHRNETLNDKCRSPHGHLYRVACCFLVVRDPNNPSISTLFSDFDIVGAYLKNQWDHTFVINQNDPLRKAMQGVSGDVPFRMKVLERTPSVENICFQLFEEILSLSEACQSLIQIEVQETETSTVIYNTEDYARDSTEFEEEPCRHNTMSPKGVCVDCGLTEFEIKQQRRRSRFRNEQSET